MNIVTETMNCFDVNFQFDDYKNFLELKKKFEIATNSIIVTEDSHRLKGSNDFVTSNVYDRITLACKAGRERPCKSRGIRASSTFKKHTLNKHVKTNNIGMNNFCHR